MHRRIMGILGSLVALIALAVTPAFAQADATLETPGGAIEANAPLTLLGSMVFDMGMLAFNCEENELNAQVTENPGASAELVASRFEGSGEEIEGKRLCPVPNTGYALDISMSSGSTIEFSGTGAVEFVDATMEMRIFSGGVPVNECSYALELGGAHLLDEWFSPLSMNGSVNKISGTCASSMSVEANFDVTSGGEQVKLVG